MIRFTFGQSWFGRPVRNDRRVIMAGKASRQLCRFVGILALAGVVAACQVRTQATQIIVPQGAVSDNVQVTDIGVDMLGAGGNATDAAVAMALAATALAPDLAGLGGGGACLTYDPGDDERQVMAFDFLPQGQPGGAAVPAMVRGLQLMHARTGDLRWSQVVAPAETEVRLNETASGAPADLAAVYSTIRTNGSAGFYNGEIARRFAEGATAAGYAISVADIRGFTPQEGPAPTVESGNELVALGPALSGRAEQITGQGGGATAPSFNLAAYDSDGTVAVCGLTMNARGGTGAIAEGTGIVIAPGQPQGGAAPAALAIRFNRFINVALDAVAVSDRPGALIPLLRTTSGDLAAARQAVSASPAPAAGIYCGIDDTRVGRCIAAPSSRPAASGQMNAVPNPAARNVIGVF